MDNTTKVSRFSSMAYLINLLSALHISKEIRKRWTSDYQTPKLIKDIQEYIGRQDKKGLNEK